MIFTMVLYIIYITKKTPPARAEGVLKCNYLIIALIIIID